MSARTPLEVLLLRDRWLIGLALGAVTVLCWAWVGPMAVDMYGSMTGWSAWMMTRNWDFTHQLLLFAMWTVMMIGMMLPSATPALFLYAAVIRKSPQTERAHAHVYLFAAGYLVTWTVFSLLATGLQMALTHWRLLSQMMEPGKTWFSGVLLLLAGVYQLTPFKRTCLDACRSPIAFITRRWKPGLLGGFRMGMEQGWYCLGCCWALMLLLFVGGVMNLWCIAALTIFVLLEKLAPLGAQGGRLSGVFFLILGVLTLSRG